MFFVNSRKKRRRGKKANVKLIVDTKGNGGDLKIEFD